MSPRPFFSPDDVTRKVREQGHYRVEVTPHGYEKVRLKSLVEMWTMIEETKVRLRGWDYPHLSPRKEERGYGVDYIASWTSWERHSELWRLFQSGQFVHLTSFPENYYEWHEKLKRWLAVDEEGITGYLSLTNVIWSITEIHEFVARLAQRIPLTEGADLKIEMHNIMGRTISEEPDRALYERYTSTVASLIKLTSGTYESLVGNARSNAVDDSIWFLERFGGDFQKRVVENIQEGLFKSRG